MNMYLSPEALMYAVYFAPRGKQRLLELGYQIAQRHLSPTDRLIGIIGDAGAGKSLLIKGMFPGLELTNDDEGINTRPLPLLKHSERGFFNSHTFHVDIRFEMAFTQLHAIVDAIRSAFENGKRVIVEHFDLIYPYLELNAEMLIGIGEEVIVTRPNIFGPLPGDIADIVFKSIRYRKMAHTAEDLTCKVLEEDFGLEHTRIHADVKHGFLLEFQSIPAVNLQELEDKVREYINAGIDVCYSDEMHIKLGKEDTYHCTGPRIHVRNTSEIENFQIVKEFRYDPISKVYALIGLVGWEKAADIKDLNKLIL